MKTKLNLVVLVLLTIFFASCDSLWQVGESTDVSMSINLRDLAGGSLFLGDEDDGFDVEFDSGNYTSFDIVVSLHNAANNSIIDSQTEQNTSSDSTGDIVFTFKAVPVSLEVYAAVHIYGNATGGVRTLIFRAQSNDTTIKMGKNNLVARPNMLFYDGNKLTHVKGSNDTIGSGDGVDILEKALEALGGRNNLAPGATVMMNDTLSISTTVIDCADLTLKAVEATQLLNITTSDVHLSNLVLEGKENNTGPLILVGNAMGALDNIIFTNIVIKDNNSSDISSAGGLYNTQEVEVIMNNCTITGNSGVKGGGVYNELGILTMNNCTVTGNSSTGNGGGVLNSSGVLLINGGVYSNNSADKGGAIWTASTNNSSYFNLIGNIEITHNTATTSGGGIYNDSDKAYDVDGGNDSSKQFVLGDGVNLSNNVAGQDGGGLYTRNARVRINGARITHNHAGSSGGGVYNSSYNNSPTNAGYGSVTIDAGVISNNSTNTGEENTGPGVYSGVNGAIIKNGGSITDLTYQE